jgi:integrase
MMAGKRRANGEGTLFRRADGFWIGRLTLDTGERKQVAAKTQVEARKKLQAARVAAAQGLPVTSDRETVGQFLERWLADSVKPNRRPKTYAGYEGNVRLHITPFLGRLPLARLTPLDVQRLMVRLRDNGLSPRSIQYVRATLRAGLQQALKWGLVARNAAALVNPPRVERDEVEPLTPDEARRLLENVRDDRLSALYSVAMALGLRQGEALGLRWEDVDLTEGQLHVRVQLQRVDGEFGLAEVKTRRSKRPIDLPAPLIDQLRAYRARQLQERLLMGERWEDHGLVFTTMWGTPLHRSDVTRRFQRILKRAWLPRKRFHDLRHTCASLLLAQGVPLHEVSELLGHSGIQITKDVYGHLYRDRRREIASQMGAFLWGERVGS